MAITPFRTTLPAHLGLSVQIDFFRYGIPPSAVAAGLANRKPSP